MVMITLAVVLLNLLSITDLSKKKKDGVVDEIV